jgi:hypothetical protein
MVSIKRPLAGDRARYPEQRFNLLNSGTWEEEIDEVLRSARQPLGNRVADPDWVAASELLVRHCRSIRLRTRIPLPENVRTNDRPEMNL